jgi:hypothetical protein
MGRYIAVALVVVGCATCPSADDPTEAMAMAEDNPGSDKAAPRDANTVKLEPIPGETGYTMEGPYGLTGTLKKPAGQAEWVLEGKFVFPTAGYTVGKPEIRVMKSLPEQVHIVLPVTPPPKDAVVAQVITEKAVSVKIRATDRARFTVKVEAGSGERK